MSAEAGTSTVGERRWVNRALGGLAWLVGLIIFFPVFWMVLNSFKTEADANTAPKLFFTPTLDEYRTVTESAGGLLSFGEAFTNSMVIVIVSTVIVLALAIPAAYALAVRPVHKWRDVLFFFISTKFLPVVAAILPVWILARNFNLLNTRLVLIILYTAINLPLAVWMLRSFFAEIPRELIEAAEIDGASPWQILKSITLPLLMPLILVALTIRGMDAFREFDSFALLTGGGPGQATEVISMMAYILAFRAYDIGRASAVSWVILILVLGFSIFFVKKLRDMQMES
jgi:sorbitol/mannitol transport system permease protein